MQLIADFFNEIMDEILDEVREFGMTKSDTLTTYLLCR